MALDRNDELVKTLFEITKTMDLSETGKSEETFIKEMVKKLSEMNLSKSDLVADPKALKISCMAHLCSIKDPSFQFDEEKLFNLLSKKDKTEEEKEDFKTSLVLVLKELYELKLKHTNKQDDSKDYEKIARLEEQLEGLKDPKEKENQDEYKEASKDLAEDALSDTLTQLYGTDITKSGSTPGIKTYVRGNPGGFQDYESDPDDPNFMAKDDKEHVEKQQEEQGLTKDLQGLAKDLDGLLDAVATMAWTSSFQLPENKR